MVYWLAQNNMYRAALVRYFKVDAVARLLDRSYEEKRAGKSLKRFINYEIFIPVINNGVYFAQHVASVFPDRILFIDVDSNSIKEEIFFVTYQDIFSGRELPEHVAIRFDDLDAIRQLYRLEKKITWVVQDLRYSAPFIFMYNYENLVIDPFQQVLVHEDGTTDWWEEVADFFKKKKWGEGGRGIFKKEKSPIKKGFDGKILTENVYHDVSMYQLMKKLNYKRFKIPPYFWIAWYNILSIYYGIYKFNLELHGNPNTSRRGK